LIDAKLVDWLDELTADCPKKQARNMSDRCGARFPQLPKIRKLSAGGWINECASYFVAVMTAGVLVFFLFKAITRQIPRDAFRTVIAIAC
jgi:hypothetical protein